MISLFMLVVRYLNINTVFMLHLAIGFINNLKNSNIILRQKEH